MWELIYPVILALITYVLDCYLFCKLVNEEFKITSKFIVLILVASLVNCYFNVNYSMQIRMIVTNIELVFLLKAIYNHSIVKILITVLMLIIGYTVSELIYALFAMSLLHIDEKILLYTLPGTIITNLCILLLNIIIIRSKIFLKISKKVINWYKDNVYINTIALVLLAIIAIASLLYPISVHNLSLEQTFILLIFLLSTITFVTGFFRQKSTSDHLSEEYDHLLDYVKIEEKELNEKSKEQHESKNQLIIIREMSTEEKVKKYITKLLDEENETFNQTLMRELVGFPTGGLQGLIYYKLRRIDTSIYEVHIDVSHEFKEKNLWEYCEKDMNDISKIIGVFLDNALDALKEEKEKYLILDLDYIDENIVFSISNTSTKHIDYEKLGTEKYTTKEKGHGFGLSLAKDLITNNKSLKSTTERNGKLFVQKLFIKTK